MDIQEVIQISKIDFQTFLEQQQFLIKEVQALRKVVESDQTPTLPKLENKWRSIKSVSNELRIEERTIRYWATKGTIQKKKIGEKVFININEVYKLLNPDSEEEMPSLKIPKRRTKRTN